jgi:site-specific DNA-methyltransferase (adenine-specific)
MQNDTSPLEQTELALNQIIIGDGRETAKMLPTTFFQSIITSPPYYGHREYSTASGNTKLADFELGRETKPQDYVQHLTEFFSELRRTLRDDGTLWLNLGDTYRDGHLLGIPWRVAFALQDDGWILRSEIIWEKPNAMPSSVKNRPSVSHETIFLFSKSNTYFYDADAIREPHVTFSSDSKMKGGRNHFGKRDSTPEQGKNGGDPNLHNGRWDQAFHPLGRNKRTVWNIALGKYRGAHFAVFPQKIPETCILASTHPSDIVLDPFMGSGTTGAVAISLNRHFIGLELVPEYAQMATERIKQVIRPLL